MTFLGITLTFSGLWDPWELSLRLIHLGVTSVWHNLENTKYSINAYEMNKCINKQRFVYVLYRYPAQCHTMQFSWMYIIKIPNILILCINYHDCHNKLCVYTLAHVYIFLWTNRKYIYIGLCIQFLPDFLKCCNFLRDKSNRSTCYSNSWLLTLVPDTEITS